MLWAMRTHSKTTVPHRPASAELWLDDPLKRLGNQWGSWIKRITDYNCVRFKSVRLNRGL